MDQMTRRGLLAEGAVGAAVAGAALLGLAGCAGGNAKGSLGAGGTWRRPNGAAGTSRRPVGRGDQAVVRPVELIGDGSMADTGPQPNQPVPGRLEPGQRPPQFVVFSWDGAGEDSKQLFSHFRAVAQEVKATMSFFLSGIYVLPEGKKDLYLPPGHKPGASDIGYLADDHVKTTLEQVRLAWLEGHEIGTHFNGHFCSPGTGVGTWSPAQWRSELEQAIGFVEKWKTNTALLDMDPLPFDYRKELIGGRTPCLLGQNQLLPTAAAMGWKYDASSPGGLQMWPGKKLGLWDFPLQSIPFPGH
ncbi:lipoprotein, partial [Streptacidiphilus neutrinimicus]|uniref:lipoprotein n=1 Tax=Streptacidiphilus neutrinimicus TaxID=105420 RepID=UPI0005A67DD8